MLLWFNTRQLQNHCMSIKSTCELDPKPCRALLQVLTTGFWPTYKVQDIDLPKEMLDSQAQFKVRSRGCNDRCSLENCFQLHSSPETLQCVSRHRSAISFQQNSNMTWPCLIRR